MNIKNPMKKNTPAKIIKTAPKAPAKALSQVEEISSPNNPNVRIINNPPNSKIKAPANICKIDTILIIIGRSFLYIIFTRLFRSVIVFELVIFLLLLSFGGSSIGFKFFLRGIRGISLD